MWGLVPPHLCSSGYKFDFKKEFHWVKASHVSFNNQKQHGGRSVDGVIVLYLPKFVAGSLQKTGKYVLNYLEECATQFVYLKSIDLVVIS